MRHWLFYVSLLAIAIPASAEIRGAWSAIVKGDRVHLSLVRDRSSWGRTLPRSEFAIAESAMHSATETPVQFTFARDAGTLEFKGTFQNGEGVGRFSFKPNRGFGESLQTLKVSTDSNIDDDDLFSLAMHDVSIAFIREMQSLGYRQSLDDYIAFRIHGVSPEFVRELRSLGYTRLSSDDLVAFRIHGVTPQFIRELRDLGYTGIADDDLVAMRIHGVTPKFIRELADAGYHNIPVEKLIAMRIHGIDAAMLAKMH